MNRFSGIRLIEYPAVLLAWYPVYGQYQIRYPAFVGYTVKLVSDPSLLIKYFLTFFLIGSFSENQLQKFYTMSMYADLEGLV